MDAIGARRRQFFAQQGIRRFDGRAPWRVRLERTNSLLQSFLESAADGHHFADGLHLRAESAVRAGKLFELPFGNFYVDVVDRRLEASGRFLGDVVGNLVERHSDGEARSDLGDWKAGSFAGKSGAARNARVHFDDRHTAIFRIDGELYV